VNVLSAQSVLEYLRVENQNASLIYTSSAKVFELSGLINESSERKSKCLYTISKNTTTDLIHYYRSKYKLKASVVWTFNHESIRRDGDYFISKIIKILVNSINDKNYQERVETLQFYADWGSAEEYMKIISYLAEKEQSYDYILATGKTLYAEEFVRQLFKNYGLNYKNHVLERIRSGNLPDPWNVDISHLFKISSLVPQKNIVELCKEMAHSQIVRIN
jgi:GDPmannose 4,6-dehydratase